jgi:uncharacterized membrane protein YbhN (UPF0104 family)
VPSGDWEAGRSGEDRDVAASAERDVRRLLRGLIGTTALALVLLGIGLAIPDLRDVLARVGRAAPGWLVLGVALELGSCLAYVAVVRLILPRAPAREARWLAWAEQAFGAVVPVGGAGGLAVGVWAMRRWGVSWSRIANRSAVIFLLTSAVNVAVLGLAGFGVWLGVGAHKSGVSYGLVPGAVGVLVLVSFCALPFVPLPERRAPRIAAGLRELAGWVRDAETIVLRPNWRLLGAAGYLLLDIAVLWACLRAVGYSPPLLALVVGYQIGYLANMIPVPGGLGVLDGGLLGALLLYGMPAAPAAAAVVLYHAIALWIPTIGGTIGFVRLHAGVAGRRQEPRSIPASEAPAENEEKQRLAA